MLSNKAKTSMASALTTGKDSVFEVFDDFCLDPQDITIKSMIEREIILFIFSEFFKIVGQEIFIRAVIV